MNLGIQKTIKIGSNEVTIETGKLAKQADGSVVVRQGNTMLLATVVSSKEGSDVDFLPLTVDYREKFAASGRFPGGFLKREARPSDNEILVMRLIDRALRPLFPDDYHAETQVMIQLMSYDGINSPDSLAGFAASAAIACSDIPFNGPMSEVRVARISGEFIINPTVEQLEKADMDLMIAGTSKDIVMLEGEMHECSEDEMVEAIKIAHESIKEQCQFQLELSKEITSSYPKRAYSHEEHDPEFKTKVYDFAFEKCKNVAREGLASKEKRGELFSVIKEDFVKTLTEEEIEEKNKFISVYFNKCKKEAVREVVLKERIRLDGRNFNEIRPIWSEVNYLPMTHGSALFTRGETQALMTLTLGGKLDEKMIDNPTLQGSERFMLHYNFPPFSTGEARPIRGTSRREIGHGNLALRALKNMLPNQEECPYTIRLVSEILESNGSSSMATVCSGTMALMDGGIKLKKPVSGIAMGLIINEKAEFAVLSDILGDEDHLGDMDFKVTGTVDGITACQMDIKVDGLPYEVLTKALSQAKEGRIHILNEMMKTISKPADNMKENAPRIESLKIPGDLIGAVIGPGGKVIQEIQKETNTTISIEEIEDGKFGMVQVMSNTGTEMQEALKRINLIVNPPQAEIGETYKGKVKSIQSYGCFVEIVPGTDGLIHISEFNWDRVEKMEDVVKEGDVVEFKVVSKDPKTKKFKLSRRVLLPKPEKKS